MKTNDPYTLRLRRCKWVILILAALILVGVEACYYSRGVPLIEDVVDWVIGMTIAVVLVEVAFRYAENLQHRLQSEIVERKQAEKNLENLVAELQEALDQIKTLKGLIPICASCKKMRDDRGYWHQVETYLSQHSEAEFSHGLCPDCFKELYPEFYEDQDQEGDASGEAERTASSSADRWP